VADSCPEASSWSSSSRNCKSASACPKWATEQGAAGDHAYQGTAADHAYQGTAAEHAHQGTADDSADCEVTSDREFQLYWSERERRSRSYRGERQRGVSDAGAVDAAYSTSSGDREAPADRAGGTLDASAFAYLRTTGQRRAASWLPTRQRKCYAVRWWLGHAGHGAFGRGFGSLD
jgi:hypothetical protein